MRLYFNYRLDRGKKHIEFCSTAERDVNCCIVKVQKTKNALPNILYFTDVYWKSMLPNGIHKQKIHCSHLKKMKSNRIKHEQRDFRHIPQVYQLVKLVKKSSSLAR